MSQRYLSLPLLLSYMMRIPTDDELHLTDPSHLLLPVRAPRLLPPLPALAPRRRRAQPRVILLRVRQVKDHVTQDLEQL